VPALAHRLDDRARVPSMANPNGQELREAVALMVERVGYNKLHDRLVRLNAFVSRRKPASPDVLADRLYSLTGGLRRQVPATLAFHTVWSETFSQSIVEDDEKRLEALADRINAALTEDEHGIRDDQRAELESALGEYERILAAAIGPRPARMDMLLKAVAPVAEILRARPLLEAGASPADQAAGEQSAAEAPARDPRGADAE
jgi:hypothetical protein